MPLVPLLAGERAVSKSAPKIRSWAERTGYAMEPKASVSISLPLRLLRVIDELARTWGTTRSATVAYLIHQGLARQRELEERYQMMEGIANAQG